MCFLSFKGGLFLRALVERCPQCRIHNLVTVGSAHQGIAKFPHCLSGSTWCRAMEYFVSHGVYSKLAQTSVVPAQYFKVWI
jgi:palmitoyl-protein thioesterase